VFGRQGEYMAGAITRTIMMNVFLGAMSPMVDNWSHLGGALGGAATAYLFGPRLMVKETTSNGGGALTIVDNPILRLPRSLEAIPEKIGDRFRFMRRRMQIESFKSELPEKPWRRNTRQNFRRRPNVPNKSVRPSF
jgi:Rhomboid family